MRITKKLCAALLCMICLLGGCGKTNDDGTESADQKAQEGARETAPVEAAFTYFYRGFTPIYNDNDIAEIIENGDLYGGILITNEEDWNYYTMRLCPYVCHYAAPDFAANYVLVDAALIGSHPSGIGSHDVEKVTLVKGILTPVYAGVSSADIYANNIDCGHLFLNILLIDKEAVPGDVNNHVFSCEKYKFAQGEQKIEEGYRAVYTSLTGAPKESAVIRQTAKNEFGYCILSESESGADCLVYDRVSKNGNCGLYVRYRCEKDESGGVDLFGGVIVDMYAYVYESKEVISSGKKAWGDAPSEEYRLAAGE